MYEKLCGKRHLHQPPWSSSCGGWLPHMMDHYKVDNWEQDGVGVREGGRDGEKDGRWREAATGVSVKCSYP